MEGDFLGLHRKQALDTLGAPEKAAIEVALQLGLVPARGSEGRVEPVGHRWV